MADKVKILEEEEEEDIKPPRCEIPGVRYIFTFMGFLGFFVIYTLRVNINVAILAMVNGTAVYQNKSSSDECPVLQSGNSSTVGESTVDGEFIWSSELQGQILGAFYYGYCVSQVPGGRLAEMYSAKWVFGLGTVISALLTLLTPVAAQTHVYLLIAFRVIEGLSQGVTIPAMFSMLARWLPECEKTLLCTIVYSGISIGTVVTMPVTGLLCQSTLFGGWPSAFYIFGIFGCLWFVFWILLVSDSPASHHFISKQEIEYITSNQTIDLFAELPPIPLRKIFHSVPFWALLITQFGQDWSFYTSMTDLPTFLDTVLHFELKKNGFLSSFPFLLQFVTGCIAGYASDVIITKRCVSKTFSRKFFNTVSSLSVVVGFIGVCLSGCNHTLTVIFLTFTISMAGFAHSGYSLNHMDLSPEYAGTLIGIGNTFSNLTGFIVPAIVGKLTNQYQTLHQWRIVFIITISVYASTSAVFLLLASGEKQDWVSDGGDHSLNAEEHAKTCCGSEGESKKVHRCNAVV